MNCYRVDFIFPRPSLPDTVEPGPFDLCRRPMRVLRSLAWVANGAKGAIHRQIGFSSPTKCLAHSKPSAARGAGDENLQVSHMREAGA